MTIDSDGDKGLPNEDKGVGDGILDTGKISVKEDDFKVDGDVNGGDQRELQAQEGLQVQQQQSQGTTVCWERFLHVRSIKVLLVENDDSTRHVVTALLRNCNYEVIEAANGLQAWLILEDLHNHVDLVLTELVMPCLSGIGLLCKIMTHKTRRNVPVIMMSTHDSMGLVFKCLSKGAVDFLVKPIRKNELKNLWQHVWRRCHSSSGSGSESGTQTQKSVHSKRSEKSHNNSGSNDAEDDESNGLNHGDGSDDGSGAQSSWTKQAVEFDSSRAASPLDQVAECPDSTCAQVIRPNAETSGTTRMHMATKKENQEEAQPDHMMKDNDLIHATTRNSELQPKNPSDVPAKLIGTKHKTLLEVTSSSRMNKGQTNPIDQIQSNIQEAVDIDTSDTLITGSEFAPPGELAKKLEIKDDPIGDTKEPTIGLRVKWPRGVKETGKFIQDNDNLLRHSEYSAFSRYNTSFNALRTLNGITGSSYLIDNNSSEVKNDTMWDIQILSNENLVCPSSKVVSNNIDMGSTTNKFQANRLFFASESMSTINGLHPSSAFNHVKVEQKNTQVRAAVLKPIDMQASSVLSPTRGLHQELQNQHRDHQDSHQHHFHNFEPQQPLSNHDRSALKKLTMDAPHCGMSNILGGPSDGNPGNHSLIRSASGSNFGSNGQNGSSTAMNAGGSNGESDMGLGRRSGIADANGSGSGNRIDQNKLAQREAALSKFRQKRKERCFKKKVRYQNRQRLAEQRPRVRGQFVRQMELDYSNNAPDD